MVPASTPRAAIDALNRAMTAYLARPETAEKLAAAAVAAAGIEPQ
jgi:hypothetical protein